MILVLSEALRAILGLKDVEFTVGKQDQGLAAREAARKFQGGSES